MTMSRDILVGIVIELVIIAAFLIVKWLVVTILKRGIKTNSLGFLSKINLKKD